jgi:hypothetical protein
MKQNEFELIISFYLVNTQNDRVPIGIKVSQRDGIYGIINWISIPIPWQPNKSIHEITINYSIPSPNDGSQTTPTDDVVAYHFALSWTKVTRLAKLAMFVAMYQLVDLNDGTSKSISNTTTFCSGNEQFLFQQSPLQKNIQMMLPTSPAGRRCCWWKYLGNLFPTNQSPVRCKSNNRWWAQV